MDNTSQNAPVSELRKIFMKNSPTSNRDMLRKFLKPSLKGSIHAIEPNTCSKNSVKFDLKTRLAHNSSFKRNVEQKEHELFEKKESLRRLNGFKIVSGKQGSREITDERFRPKVKKSLTTIQPPFRNASESPFLTRNDNQHAHFSANHLEARNRNQQMVYEINLSEILRSDAIGRQNMNGFRQNHLTGASRDDNNASLTNSEDSGFLIEHSNSSYKDSGSDMSNLDPLVTIGTGSHPRKKGESILEGVIVNTGSHNCLALKRRDSMRLDDGWIHSEKKFSSFIQLQSPHYFSNTYEEELSNRALRRNESEPYSGHFRRKEPANRQRVESIKRYSVHQPKHRHHNSHRKPHRNVTRISVGNEDVNDTVYFSEPEYIDDDEDGWNNIETNPHKTHSQGILVHAGSLSEWSDDTNQNSTKVEQNSERAPPHLGNPSRNSAGKGVRRHTCEVDFSDRRNDEYRNNERNIAGSLNSLVSRSNSHPITRSLSELSFTIDLTGVIKQNDNYRVSLVMSPTDDQPFSFSESSTKLDQRDVAIQTKEVSTLSNDQQEVDQLETSSHCSNKSSESPKILERHQQNQDHQLSRHRIPHQKQEPLQQKQEEQNKQQNEAKASKDNSKPQRKESVLSRIFNTSFTMARKGFREKWLQRRDGANEKKESKTKDQRPPMERCFSGRQLNSFESKKTVTISRNKKTFLPHTSSLHSSEATSSDSLLDDIDGSWIDEFEDGSSFSKFQMWDFEDKLKGKPDRPAENNCQNNGTDKGQNEFEIVLLLLFLQYATTIEGRNWEGAERGGGTCPLGKC